MAMCCLGKCYRDLLLGMGLNNFFFCEGFLFLFFYRSLVFFSFRLKEKNLKIVVLVLNLFLKIKDLSIYVVFFRYFFDVYLFWNIERGVWDKIVFY